jgi:hypothetical protein
MYKRPQLRKRVYGPFLPLEYKPTPVVEPVEWKFDFKPIKYIDSYICAMRSNGATEDELEDIKARHTVTASAPPVQVDTKWVCPVKYLDQVLVNLVVKGNRVKLSLNIPFDEAIPYYSAGKVPPIETRIRCMKRAGAPRNLLIDALKKHEAYYSKKNLEKEQKKIDKAFMKFNVKPTTKILKPVKKKIT